MNKSQIFKYMVNDYFLLPALRAEAKNEAIVRVSRSIWGLEKIELSASLKAVVIQVTLGQSDKSIAASGAREASTGSGGILILE